ncbi:hypothetical protein ACFS27_13610 [Promicromonospora vindobonensis]|uniref:Uncharacterized protein n=1 Tax=Promicromonospora vindobonensis TaxID=195748 RepID=A0ABW5VWB8_9MICO
MITPTTKDDVTIVFGTTELTELTGSLHHDMGYQALTLMTDEGPERLSVNLLDYGFIARPGNVFIKDWSEGEGLTARLEAAGLVKRVHKVVVGPFCSTAYEVEVTLG